jgi:DNA (cytosine-5)-methyltransferase 1
MRLASLFTGVGGAEMAFDRVWNETYHVAFAEFDAMASRVLKERFPWTPNYGDITKIDWGKFPKCDLLHASPACQGFSVAGKGQGMDDDLGRGLPLWEAYFKCLETVRPPVFTLEEVPPLAFSKKFADEWKWILSEWARIGYHVKYTKLQALDFDVPQSRNRLITVGFLDKAKCDAFEWPEPTPQTRKLKDILQQESEVDRKFYLSAAAIIKLLDKMTPDQVERLLGLSSPLKGVLIKEGTVAVQNGGHSNCITANYGKGADNHGQRTQVAILDDTQGFDGVRIYDNVSPSLRSERNGVKVTVIDPYNLTVPKDQDATTTLRTNHSNGNAQIAVINGGSSQHDRIYDTDGVSPALAGSTGFSSSKHPYVVAQREDGKPYIQVGGRSIAIRRLTPVETCRLMDWPDGWNDVTYPSPTKKNPDKTKRMSDSSRYRQCGNGLVSAVMEGVAWQIAKVI